MYQEDELEGDYYVDQSLNNFETYEEYLDDHMSSEDLFFLEDKELARQLIEIGYHGKGEILSREDFKAKKEELSNYKSKS